MAVQSDGTSTQHLGGIGGNNFANPASFLVWLKLNATPSALNHFLLVTNQGSDALACSVEENRHMQGILVQDGLISDGPTTIQSAMTLSKWYHFAVVRVDSDTFEYYVGEEAVASSLRTTLTELLEAMNPGSVGLGGSSSAGSSPQCSVERWKHYARALNVNEINAERLSLAPSSTTNLVSYNNLITADATGYAGSQGSVNYNFSEQGGTGFSTDSNGPSPSAGGGGGSPLFPPFPRPLDSHAMLRMRNPKKEDWRKSRGGVWYVAETIKQAA